MNHPAKYTNGDWKLPDHARGVHREQVQPTNHHAAKIVLKDPKRPEAGWKFEG